MKEKVLVSGHFVAIVKKFISGVWVPIKKIEQKNQVLNGLLEYLSLAATGGTVETITQLTFGTGTDAPNRTDTIDTMENPFVNTLIGVVEYPAYNKFKYTFALLPAENNGVNISEYALTLSDDSILCRITRGIVEKSVNIRIDGTWEITIDI